MAKLKKQINGWTAFVFVVFILAVLAAYLLGPMLGVGEDAHSQLVAGVAIVGALFLAQTKKIFERDKDGDGIPDAFDDEDNTKEGES